MWLGMLAALVGQLPGLPVRAADRPRRAARRLRRPGRPLARLAGLGAGERPAAQRRRACWPRTSRSPWCSGSCSPGRAVAGACGGRRAAVKPLALAACLGVLGLALAGLRRGAERRPSPRAGLRVVVLDVGQGDAILLDPADGRARARGRRAARRRPSPPARGRGGLGLAAAVVTHDQSDHAGGIEELLGSFPVHRLLYGERGPDLLAGCARPPASARCRSPRGRRSIRGACGSRSLWPPRAAARRRLRRATRTRRRSCCLPAGGASACCSPPTPRRRRCRSTPGRSTCSRWPTTARTTPASMRCSTAASRASR